MLNSRMEPNIILLRAQPRFEILLSENSFTVHDESKRNPNKRYLYSKIDSVKIHKTKINWFATFLTLVVSFMLSAGIEKIIMEKFTLAFNYENRKVRLLLNNCDSIKVNGLQRVIEKKSLSFGSFPYFPFR